MIGLVIVAHGALAQSFLDTVSHVVGEVPNAIAIGLEPKDDLAARRLDIEAAIDAVDTGDGVVIATDLLGGTPANLAIAAMAERRVDVISGANLPLLIKLATSRDSPRRDAVAAAVEAGRKYILDAEAVLGSEA